MAPIVNGLKPQYEDTVAIRMYNVETSEVGNQLAQQYGVQFVPTFVFVNSDGSLANTVIGETSEDGLKTELDRLE
ncbi:MAG: thioredoxin domain-containing protein [Coriobacteriia bacterium]|nr:thioredoxin domain-containing protein [Coriobacteriia bacterium]